MFWFCQEWHFNSQLDVDDDDARILTNSFHSCNVIWDMAKAINVIFSKVNMRFSTIQLPD